MAWTDRDALLELFRSTGGEKWTRKDNWGTDIVLWRWHGVKVDGRGRVVELELQGDHLRVCRRSYPLRSREALGPSASGPIRQQAEWFHPGGAGSSQRAAAADSRRQPAYRRNPGVSRTAWQPAGAQPVLEPAQR